MNALSMRWADEELNLLPARALFWPRRRTLFVADLHLGKDATFRAAGIAIPTGVVEKDLARLEQTLAATSAERLVILGDFFHARPGRTSETESLFSAWRKRHSTVEMLLIRGNHDRHAGEPLAEWCIHNAGEALDLRPFLCQHEPLPTEAVTQHRTEDGYILAGHLHPVTALRERGGASLRLPCFFFGAKQAILPAFGSFTGGYSMKPGAADQIFVVSPNGVTQVK